MLADQNCPKCGGMAVTVCHCPLMHSECMDGHTWFYQWRTLRKIVNQDVICRRNHNRRRDDRQNQNV
jgi:hypothetical protein